LVNKPVKIGLMGVHSGGKTTMTDSLKGKLKRLGYTVNAAPEAARQAVKHGFELDRKSDLNAQTWILGRVICNEIEAMSEPVAFVITDRTVWDSLAMALANHLETAMLSEIILSYDYHNPYDLIIYFPPLETPPQFDGVRDMDVSYQQKVGLAFQSVISQYGLEVYTLISKNKDDRYTECKNILARRFGVAGMLSNEI